LLGDGHRITDLCPVGEGFFAASIDTVGIVFFDREGRTLQVLERSLDHRLARVQRVLYSANGVLRALLNDGVARISFPSPVSHFEPLLASGLAYAQPLRHAGKLWILADGRAMRGIYGGGRLDRFEDDTPPGRYLLTLAEVDGQLFGANETGIYVYEEAGWKLILPGIVNARIGVARSAPDGIFYVARGEYGLIQHTGSEFTARRIPKQELGDSYGSVVDSAGIGWLELGSSRVGRLDPHGGQPSCQILGSGDGLPDGWVELYVLDGITRFHVANHLYRFDDTRRKFVEDVELLARIPQLAVAGGRPVTDSFGRLWYTANGGIQVIDHTAAGNNRPVKVPAVGFAPTSYTAEDDGVVWMFEQRHLARLDLRLPETPASPLVAFITSVQFPASGREAFAPGGTLEPLNYADNSLVLHFVAPANPFGVPVTFEFLLNGAGTQWISTGAVGSARFTGLKEGAYTFRVRPVAGSVTRGTEARLAFRVKPPWFRTKLAWTVYIATALALLAFVIWLPSYLQRRKNDNLERLVASRTGELNTTNAQLARQIQETTEKSAALSASEERYRLLNTGLEDRVAERTRELASSVSVLNATFESTTDGIVIVELSGQVKSFNNKFAELWHLPPELRSAGDPEPLIAHVCRQVKEPDRFREWIGRVMVDPQTGSFGLLELVDGRTFEQTAMPCWIDGICVGWVFSVRNITFRKQAEAKLAYERDQFRALLDSIPDTIYFKDTQSRFVLVSRSAVQNAVARLPDLRARRAARGLVVDVPEADLLTGLTDFDTYQDADAQLAFEDEKQIIRSGEALIGKLEQQTFLDHAVRWSLTSKMPWRDPDGKIIGTFGISKDVTDLKETEAKLGQMHEQLIESSRMAGMAEVATGVLHNVGNVLNSVNVSATLVADKVRHSKATNLAKVCSLLAQHQADLANFLTTDPKGRIVPVYLANLSDTLAAEQKSVTAELDNLRKNIEHIKEIVGMQQDYAKTSGVNETVSVPDLVEDALRINTGSLARHEVDVSRDYVARPVVTLDKHKVIQILINLIRNAKYACDESARSDKLITVRTTADLRNFTIAVIDNGIGIPAANLARIFSHGFTTRKAGHGFGLHSGALAARELGGSLSAQSDGPGLGATFTLVLPFKSEATPP
jgi:C4-dicarboxylate-specific signal transduction histidine kinase